MYKKHLEKKHFIIIMKNVEKRLVTKDGPKVALLRRVRLDCLAPCTSSLPVYTGPWCEVVQPAADRIV